MTQPFRLPTSWIAEPYPTHFSFAYEGDSGRDDFDFRVEFTDGVPANEQLAVIDLIEAAPRLLISLDRLLAAIGTQSVRIDQGDMLDALQEAINAVAAVRGGSA